MKRRTLGLMSGASLAALSIHKPAKAADASLLGTTLTPLGAEKAGNADGSIPAWTGGLVDPTALTHVNPYANEQPLVVVTASNLAQYQQYVSEGMAALINKYAYELYLYPTHRTAAAPQYVYDNTVKNVATAALEPDGGRLGFTGAYGGVPFPIIDQNADPLISGAQIIWNHLTHWSGFCSTEKFSSTWAVSGGKAVISQGLMSKIRSPYYDPDGDLASFGGYLNLTHAYFSAPATLQGQEDLVWHTANTKYHSDITWTLLNGQGRVRKTPDEQFDTPSAPTNGVSNIDEGQGFSGEPIQYDWKLLGKKEMFVPYHNNNIMFTAAKDVLGPKTPNGNQIRFEKHRVWVVEATLHTGYRNVLSRRVFYIDEDTWGLRLGDCYDSNNALYKVEWNFCRTVPVLPGTTDLGFATINVQTGDYAVTAQFYDPPMSGEDSFAVIPLSIFDPQQMSASASF